MQVTVTIHEAWLARPEDLRRVMALLAGLEVPPPGPAATDRPAVKPQGYDPREYIEEPFDPEGRAPARPSNRSDRGDAWEPPAEDPDEDCAAGREAVARLGVEADPGPEGGPDRLRQEEGAALEDRGMDAPAGRGRVPVRPGAIGLDPITLPTPRADAFRARLPQYRGHWTRRQLVAWRRIVLEEILGQIQSDRPV